MKDKLDKSIHWPDSPKNTQMIDIVLTTEKKKLYKLLYDCQIMLAESNIKDENYKAISTRLIEAKKVLLAEVESSEDKEEKADYTGYICVEHLINETYQVNNQTKGTVYFQGTKEECEVKYQEILSSIINKLGSP